MGLGPWLCITATAATASELGGCCLPLASRSPKPSYERKVGQGASTPLLDPFTGRRKGGELGGCNGFWQAACEKASTGLGRMKAIKAYWQ